MIPGDYGGPFFHDSSIYRSAFVPVAAVILVFPALGIARAAVDLFVGGSARAASSTQATSNNRKRR